MSLKSHPIYLTNETFGIAIGESGDRPRLSDPMHAAQRLGLSPKSLEPDPLSGVAAAPEVGSARLVQVGLAPEV